MGSIADCPAVQPPNRSCKQQQHVMAANCAAATAGRPSLYGTCHDLQLCCSPHARLQLTS